MIVDRYRLYIDREIRNDSSGFSEEYKHNFTNKADKEVFFLEM